MKIAGAIGVDRKPRQRKTLGERIEAQDAAIARLAMKLERAKSKRARMLDEPESKARAMLAAVSAMKTSQA